MNVRVQVNRILLPVLAIVVLVSSSLAVYLRIEQRRLTAQVQRLQAEIHDLQPPRDTVPKYLQNKPSPLLNAPITGKTALSFFWFGDMDSHFRLPINFFVVPDADRKLHKVEIPDRDSQVNVVISAGEMKRILDGLKSLNLRWADLRGREVFKGTFHRKATDMLDVTLVSSDATAKANIRIARMCDELGQ